MNWMDHECYLEIYPPIEFNYEECLVFLCRSDQEVLQVEFPISPPHENARKEAALYVWEWFDLERKPAIEEINQIATNWEG